VDLRCPDDLQLHPNQPVANLPAALSLPLSRWWKEKDTRAAMLFGRAFENALGAFFRHEDSPAALFREWAVFQEAGLQYSNGDTWDRMLQQGLQLLDRFARMIECASVSLAAVSRSSSLDRFPRRTTSSPMSMPWGSWMGKGVCWSGRLHPADIRRNRTFTSPRSAAGLLLLDHGHLRRGSNRLRPQEADRSSVPQNHHHRRATTRIWPPG